MLQSNYSSRYPITSNLARILPEPEKALPFLNRIAERLYQDKELELIAQGQLEGIVRIIDKHYKGSEVKALGEFDNAYNLATQRGKRTGLRAYAKFGDIPNPLETIERRLDIGRKKLKQNTEGSQILKKTKELLEKWLVDTTQPSNIRGTSQARSLPRSGRRNGKNVG